MKPYRIDYRWKAKPPDGPPIVWRDGGSYDDEAEAVREAHKYNDEDKFHEYRVVRQEVIYGDEF